MSFDPMFDFGDGPVPAHQHVNGGGWVADTAHVGPNAWIHGDARVSGHARVYDGACVYGHAQISGYAQIYGDARVYDRAGVSGNAWIHDDARIFGDARICGNARISGSAWVLRGEWAESPPSVQIGRWFVGVYAPGRIKIGCTELSAVDWAEQWRTLADEEEATEHEIALGEAILPPFFAFVAGMV